MAGRKGECSANFSYHKIYKVGNACLCMKTVTISKQKYEALKKKAQVDEELLRDISRGIKDILTGKVKEV